MQYNDRMTASRMKKDETATTLFIVFTSILLGGFGLFTAYSLWQAGQPAFALLNSLLFAIHIGLHWINIKNGDTIRWWAIYYTVQTIIIITIAGILSQFDPQLDVNFLGSAMITMIAEALGVWGNTRRALLVGASYFIIYVSLFLILAENREMLNFLPGLFINGGFIILIMVLFNQQSHEREKAETLAKNLEGANVKLAAYSNQIEELTRTTERQRIARELHDTLAQGLVGLTLQLEAVKAHLQSDSPGRAEEIVEQSLTRARSTLAESRAAIDDLRAVQTSLSQAVQNKAQRFTEATGIPCHINFPLDANHILPPALRDHTFRIFNEALTNITRHAQATEVWVTWLVKDGYLELEIRDNGRGFNLETVDSLGHYGLLGMRERARLINGKLSVKSKIKQGTQILLKIPFS